MAENRVSIKINFDKDRHRKELIDPKMVTVWHTGRILTALGILTLLISSIIFWLTDNNTADTPPPAAIIKPSENPPLVPIANNATDSAKPIDIAKPQPPAPKPKSKPTVTTQRPPAIIYDRKVIRASLNLAPRYGEPGKPVKPLVTIKPNQAMDLFYFSEIKHMKGRTLFHNWSKDGKTVHKQAFQILTDKFKLISSKKFTNKERGEWSVMLTDDKNKKLSAAYFSINP